MQTMTAFRRTYGAAMGEFGEGPAQIELKRARRAAEHARLALVTYPGGHPLALTANLTWQAAEKAANAARSAQDKTAVWRDAEKAMRALNLHGEALAEAVAEQGARIAEIQAETRQKAPPPPPPPSASQIIAEMRARGVTLTVDGDHVVIGNHVFANPAELDAIRVRKREFVTALRCESVVI